MPKRKRESAPSQPNGAKPTLVGRPPEPDTARERPNPQPQEQNASTGQPGPVPAGRDPTKGGPRVYPLAAVRGWKNAIRNGLQQGMTFDQAAMTLQANIELTQGFRVSRRFMKDLVRVVLEEWAESDARNAKFAKAKAVRLAHEAIRATKGEWDAANSRWRKAPNYGAHVAALEHLARLEGTLTPVRVEVERSEMEAKFGFFMSLPPEKQKHYLEAAEAKLKTG